MNWKRNASTQMLTLQPPTRYANVFPMRTAYGRKSIPDVQRRNTWIAYDVRCTINVNEMDDNDRRRLLRVTVKQSRLARENQKYCCRRNDQVKRKPIYYSRKRSERISSLYPLRTVCNLQKRWIFIILEFRSAVVPECECRCWKAKYFAIRATVLHKLCFCLVKSKQQQQHQH